MVASEAGGGTATQRRPGLFGRVKRSGNPLFGGVSRTYCGPAPSRPAGRGGPRPPPRGARAKGGYTLTMRAGGGGEIGAVFNDDESYDEEDRSHPHPPHLETHCLQYQEGWPWMGSKAYAMQWGQGSVYADFAESGDDEEYCGSCDKDETACGLTSISTAVASSPPTNMCGCSRTHFLFPIAVERQARFLC